MARRGGVEKRSVENSSIFKERSIKGNGKKEERVCAENLRDKRKRGKKEGEERKKRKRGEEIL